MHPTLKYGSRGGVVRAMQQLLSETEHAKPGLARDGIFGPRTQAAVKRFQTRKKLEIDGVVGPSTWAALGDTLRLGQLAASAGRAAAAAAAQSSSPAPAAIPFVGTRSAPSRATPSRAYTPPAQAAAPAPKPAPVKRIISAPHVSADVGGGSGDPAWYAAALAEFQAHHTIFGNADGNKRIHEYFKCTSYPHVLGNKVPWCSAFVNWCMKQANIEGTHNALAVSWLKWGIELQEPRHGCVMVVHWVNGGNHVTFFDRASENTISYLGGNQTKASAITDSTARRSAFKSVHYRWPNNG